MQSGFLLEASSLVIGVSTHPRILRAPPGLSARSFCWKLTHSIVLSAPEQTEHQLPALAETEGQELGTEYPLSVPEDMDQKHFQ